MLSVLRSLWIWAASATLIASRLPVMAVIHLFERDPLYRRTGRSFRSLGRWLTKVNPWRLHVTGEHNVEPGATYVIVSNHQSLADIPVITHVRIDTKWLAKAELFRVPIVGQLMRLAGDIPVQRGDRRQAAQALLQAAHYLRQGCSVVFFPEGTRSRDGQMLPFNDGPFKLAIREQVAVLPMVVEGSGAALPRHTWKFGPAMDIHLSVLAPVPTGGMDVTQSGELREEVRRRMSEHLQQLRAHVHPAQPV